MKELKSKKNNNKILHIVLKSKDIKDNRLDLISPDNFLQSAALKFDKGKKFEAHRHLWKENNIDKSIAQESWVVIKGKIKVLYFDEDETFLQDEILEAGDITITLEGGHAYEILEDDTLVYEFKTGPYEGQIKDKVYF